MFYANLAQASAASLLVTTDRKGLAPVADPKATGKLEYTIAIEGHEAVALLDHGSSVSFVNQDWCERHCLPIHRLQKPLVLSQFTGPGPNVSSQLRSVDILFAGVRRRWTFFVLVTMPAEVVVGLDFVRSWGLCHNPLNDHVLLVDTGRVKCSVGGLGLANSG